MKFMSCDIETTGLDPKVHGIIQFAAVWADDDGKLEPQKFHAWIKPQGMVWDIYCLRLHQKWLANVLDRIYADATDYINIREPRIFDTIEKMIDDFESWLRIKQIKADEKDRFNALGKNFGSFDQRFLDANGMNGYWRRRALDATPYYTLKTDEKPPELKVCKERAMNRGCMFESAEVAHTALEDALDVMTLYQFYHQNPWLIGT